jgi:multidrug resistance efflux pump
MRQLFPQEIINNSAENYFVTQNTASKVIYLALVVLLLGIVILLPIVTIDITTQSSGLIRSRYEDNILQSAVYGEIIQANIAENLVVNQGDTLLVISTQKTDEQINYYNIQLAEETIHLNDLALLLGNNPSHLASTLYKQEHAGFRGKLEEQKVKMAQVDKDFALASTLYEKKVIPKTEYEDKKSAHDIEISRYQNICEQQKLVWQSRYTELKTKMEGIKSNIEQLDREKKQYILTAPLSGTITGYTGVKQGNFIVPNQQIGRISPDNELLVECYVSPSNIGLIHNDMKVNFQFHSFNYNQ